VVILIRLRRRSRPILTIVQGEIRRKILRLTLKLRKRLELQEALVRAIKGLGSNSMKLVLKVQLKWLTIKLIIDL
jgi:hypothetical protein